MKRALRTVLALAAIICAALAVRTFVFAPVRIAGTSMADTLQSGDVVLIARFDRTPGFGDIMECRFPGRDATYVKRVIGLPGDTTVFSDGMLTVNGTPLSEPYVSSPTSDFSATAGADEYLVLGDNRAESYDSRAAEIGMIGSEDFLGRAIFILWPPGRIGIPQ